MQTPVIRHMKKGTWGKTKAYFDVEIGAITIKGCRLVEGQNGLFASMPTKTQEQDDGNVVYQNIVYLDKELLIEVLNAAKIRYEEPIDEVKSYNSTEEASKDLPF